MTFLKVWTSHTHTNGMIIGSSFIFIYRDYTLTPFFDCCCSNGLVLKEEGHNFTRCPSIHHNSSIFFSHCVSFFLGSLPPQQLIVHRLTTAFLHIIYCVHWFHLNSIICTKGSVSLFHGTFVCLRYTWIKVLRCGICWSSFWFKEPAVYSWRFSGITGTALLLCTISSPRVCCG